MPASDAAQEIAKGIARKVDAGLLTHQDAWICLGPPLVGLVLNQLEKLTEAVQSLEMSIRSGKQ